MASSFLSLMRQTKKRALRRRSAFRRHQLERREPTSGNMTIPMATFTLSHSNESAKGPLGLVFVPYPVPENRPSPLGSDELPVENNPPSSARYSSAHCNKGAGAPRTRRESFHYPKGYLQTQPAEFLILRDLDVLGSFHLRESFLKILRASGFSSG
jgi:hypothetical protein